MSVDECFNRSFLYSPNNSVYKPRDKWTINIELILGLYYLIPYHYTDQNFACVIIAHLKGFESSVIVRKGFLISNM